MYTRLLTKPRQAWSSSNKMPIVDVVTMTNKLLQGQIDFTRLSSVWKRGADADIECFKMLLPILVSSLQRRMYDILFSLLYRNNHDMIMRTLTRHSMWCTRSTMFSLIDRRSPC